MLKQERRHIGPALVDVNMTEEEVRKKLLNLNGSKSEGPHCFHSRCLKEMTNTSTGPLRLIFQKSLDEGILTEDWRTANVTLIHKKGGKKKTGSKLLPWKSHFGGRKNHGECCEGCCGEAHDNT